jgi:aminoglycoside phosphotransferase (APT) family kinase protein
LLQERVEGPELGALAMLYDEDMAPGADPVRPDGANSKAALRALARTWLDRAGALPAPPPPAAAVAGAVATAAAWEASAEGRAALAGALTKLLQARLAAAFAVFHHRCGVLHDDMHSGNVVLQRARGEVKVIDWELGRVAEVLTSVFVSFFYELTTNSLLVSPSLLYADLLRRAACPSRRRAPWRCSRPRRRATRRRPRAAVTRWSVRSTAPTR